MRLAPEGAKAEWPTTHACLARFDPGVVRGSERGALQVENLQVPERVRAESSWWAFRDAL